MAEKSPPLSLWVKICFGAPAFAGAGLSIPIVIHLPQFYSDVVLVPLGYIALTIAIARAFDAITDPLMGWISDSSQTRWGRRKPYIFVGAPLCAIAFWALLTPPQNFNQFQAGMWFAACFALYFLFHTVYEVCHKSLGAEITLDYHERSNLFGISAMFIQFGVISAAIAPAVLTAILGKGNERQVFFYIGITYGILLVSLYMLLLKYVPERREFMQRKANPLVPGVRRALRNRPFRIIFISSVIHAIPAAIPAVLVRYYTFYVLQPQQRELWLSVFLVIYILTGAIFIPIWMKVARHYGKLKTFVAASLFGICGSVLFFFAGPGDTTYVAIVFVIVGVQSSAQLFLTPAMGADTIDYDEFLTGKRREAQYTAFYTIIPKFIAVPGSAIPLAIIAAVGYIPGQEQQSAEVVFTIKFLFALFPVFFYTAALANLLRYPISADIHDKIRQGIAAHTRGEAALDPLTGKQVSPPQSRQVDEQMGWFLDYFSARELRRVVAKGSAKIVSDVAVTVLLSLGGFAAAVWMTMHQLGDWSQKPGPGAVIAVVIAGLSLTALLFHLVRIKPARQLAQGTVDKETIESHIRDSEIFS